MSSMLGHLKKDYSSQAARWNLAPGRRCKTRVKTVIRAGVEMPLTLIRDAVGYLGCTCVW